MPASQPGDTVLVRIGDGAEVVTQHEFERVMVGFPESSFEALKDQKMRDYVNDELLMLYIRDHNLAPEEEVQADIKKSMDVAGLKTHEQLLERLKERNRTFHEYKRYKTLQLGTAKIIRKAMEAAKDEDNLKKLWNSEPGAFDGTRVVARHIMLETVPYQTPGQIEATLAKLQKILDDLNAGRINWSDAVKHSEDNVTKAREGNLGPFQRHGAIIEPVAAAAWKLMVGERSGIVKSDLGFHIVETTDRLPGTRKFEDSDSMRDMKIWMERAAFLNALREAREKYPVVGVRPPTKFEYPPPPNWQTRPAMSFPPRPATRPATRPAVRPTTRPTVRPLTRPAIRPTTRPGARLTTRPGRLARPATRPAPSGTRRPTGTATPQ